MVVPLAKMKKVPMNRKDTTLIKLFSGLWRKYSIIRENLQKKYQKKYKECHTRNVIQELSYKKLACEKLSP